MAKAVRLVAGGFHLCGVGEGRESGEGEKLYAAARMGSNGAGGVFIDAVSGG
jgi:hypothetical protein